MLIAILNCCTKEELEEEDETPEPVTPEAAIEEAAADSSAETDSGELFLVTGLADIEDMGVERRQVIKNKILAVGRMSRVFALLRCVLVQTVIADF
jgi:serine/threonine-protein phosphatase 2B catalytic subunit